MKILTKIIVFVLIVTLGIAVIGSSLSAMRHPCYCYNDTEADMDCIWICASIDSECLVVFPMDSGCEYGDCDTLWRFYCENNARGYLYTSAPNCSDCDWIW